jgi:hypothetical protein
MSDQAGALLEILVAEIRTVRDTIDRRVAAIMGLVSFNATAVAAVAGFVLSNKADVRLLMILPIFSASFGLLVFDHDRDIRVARRYADDVLRPLIIRLTHEDGLLSHNHMAPRSLGYEIAVQAIPFGLLFPGASVVALVVVTPYLTGPMDWFGWVFGAVLLATLLTVWSRRLVDIVQDRRSPRPRTPVESRASDSDPAAG